jgi:hypothetical protein
VSQQDEGDGRAYDLLGVDDSRRTYLGWLTWALEGALKGLKELGCGDNGEENNGRMSRVKVCVKCLVVLRLP